LTEGCYNRLKRLLFGHYNLLQKALDDAQQIPHVTIAAINENDAAVKVLKQYRGNIDIDLITPGTAGKAFHQRVRNKYRALQNSIDRSRGRRNLAQIVHRPARNASS
jgi:subtilisin-like proprotein convertase family protein